MVGLAALDHKAHTHGMIVGNIKSEFLAKLALCLAANAIFRAREGSEDRVARAVNEDLCVDLVPGVCGELEALDILDLVTVHLGVTASAVEHKIDVVLETDELVENGVPDSEVSLRVAVHILKEKLLHDACFLKIADSCARARDPHSDLARAVTAKNGSVLHKGYLCALSCRGNCGEHTADTAAHNANIDVVNLCFKHFTHWFFSYVINN